MGRFYKTAQPTFIDDFIYQPPWELLQSILSNKQEGYNQTLATTELFKDLQIKHRDTDEENQAVSEIKEYYNTEADKLANELKKNPENYVKLQSRLKELGRQLNSDYAEGAISRIEGTYNNFQDWLKKHEEYQKKDPELFNALLKEAEDKWGGSTLKNQVWGQEKQIDRPDFQKHLEEIKKELVASAYKNDVDQINGYYILNNVNGKKEINEQQLTEAALAKLEMDPLYKSYAMQSQRVGIGDYTQPRFNTAYIDIKNKKEITEEEYNALKDKKDENGNPLVTSEKYLNPEHPDYGYLASAGTQAYSEIERKFGIKQNTTATTLKGQAEAMQRHRQSLAETIRHNKAVEGLNRDKFNFEVDKYNQDKIDKKISNLDLVINNPKSDTKDVEEAKRQKDQILGIPDYINFKGEDLNLKSIFSQNKEHLLLDLVKRKDLPENLKSLFTPDIIKKIEKKEIKSEDDLKKSLLAVKLFTKEGEKELREKWRESYGHMYGFGKAWNSSPEEFKKAEDKFIANAKKDPLKYIEQNKSMWGSGGYDKTIPRALKSMNSSIEEINSSLGKYNADIGQDALALTKQQRERVDNYINSSPNSFTFYDQATGKPYSMTELNNVTFKSDLVGAGAKGRATRVVQGKIGNKRYIAVPRESGRTSPEVMRLKYDTQTWAGTNTPLGRAFNDDDIALRTSVGNEYIRANTNNGKWYSPVINDPAGTEYGIQYTASGNTKDGVSGVYVYKPNNTGHYTPYDKINDEPLTVEEATQFINNLNSR